MVEELLGHYVNYRKAVGTETEDISLYAVTSMNPENLMSLVNMRKLKAGVYEFCAVSRLIHEIVTSEVSEDSRNTLWNLFSNKKEQYCRELKTIIGKPLVIEVLSMPYKKYIKRRE